jgi:hypothetical protein
LTPTCSFPPWLKTRLQKNSSSFIQGPSCFHPLFLRSSIIYLLKFNLILIIVILKFNFILIKVDFQRPQMTLKKDGFPFPFSVRIPPDRTSVLSYPIDLQNHLLISIYMRKPF